MSSEVVEAKHTPDGKQVRCGVEGCIHILATVKETLDSTPDPEAVPGVVTRRALKPVKELRLTKGFELHPDKTFAQRGTHPDPEVTKLHIARMNQQKQLVREGRAANPEAGRQSPWRGAGVTQAQLDAKPLLVVCPLHRVRNRIKCVVRADV